MQLEDWARLGPADWPYTPPLDIFMSLAERDGNLWWRISCGHHLNLFEEATERLEASK